MLAGLSRVNVPEEARRDFYVYADEVHSYAGNLAEMLSGAAVPHKTSS